MKPDQLFKHWEQVRQQLYETIDKFQESELTYQPFSTSWTVGQIMLHIAEVEELWIGSIVLKEATPSLEYELADYPTKAKIKRVLKKSHQHTEKLLAGLEEVDLQKKYHTENDAILSLYWILWHVVEHEIHHRGELSLILGLLGREGLDV
jgi:uncharacterized damage-inducible protein DinB